MSNHAHLRPHNAVRPGPDRARIRGAIPDAYAGKRPAWRRPARATGPDVRTLAKQEAAARERMVQSVRVGVERGPARRRRTSDQPRRRSLNIQMRQDRRT